MSGAEATSENVTMRTMRRSGDEDADKVVEPTTWAALAYSGFIWWASAGEQRRGNDAEESAHDATLLADLAPPMLAPNRRASFGGLSSSGLIDSVASLGGRGTDGGDDEEADREEHDRAA